MPRKGQMELLGSAQPRNFNPGINGQKNAPAIDWTEVRVDPSDGNAYPRQSFLEVYGEWGYMSVWEKAQPLPPPEPEASPEEIAAQNQQFMEDQAMAVAKAWEDEAARQELVGALLGAMAGTAAEPEAPPPARAAYGLAGAVREMGAPALTKFGIGDALSELLGKSPKSAEMNAALTAVTHFVESLGYEAVAFVLPRLLPLLRGSDGPAAARQMTDRLITALVAAATPDDVAPMVAAAVSALGESSRKLRAAALAVLNGLARRQNEPELLAQVSRAVPAVIPRLIDSCHETDPKISETAHAALDAVTLTIDHTETQKLRKLLLSAILFADKHTHECLDALSEMTFVNALDAASLALMVPVLARGLRERSSSVVKQASMTASNIFALVRDPKELVTHPHGTLPLAPPHLEAPPFVRVQLWC